VAPLLDSSNAGGEGSTKDPSNNSKNADLAAKLQGTKPQVFTIGDGSRVYNDNHWHQLAQDYVTQQMQQAAQEESPQEDEALAELINEYVHVFLDVPADISGQRPHQALINFQRLLPVKDTNGGSTGTANKSNPKNKKKSNKSKQKSTQQSSQQQVQTTPDGAIIVKIQRAAPLSPDDKTMHPMLLYDQSRTLRTFVHPHPSDQGYEKIAALVESGGAGGVLGHSGGTKAYFYARLTKRDDKSKHNQELDILSIRITELAPPQEW